MSQDAAKDLDAWVPRLIRVWRDFQKDERSRKTKRGEPRRQLDDESKPEHTLTQEELHQVSAGVRQLSLGLTRDRSLAGAKYMDDPRLLGAYLLFYWPVSYAQARSVMNELPNKPRQVLDLGSGPGPISFAAMDAGASTVIAADRSRPALEIARALAIEGGEGVATREWSPEKPIPEGQFDLITMGHVLNELFAGNVDARAALVEKIMPRVKPGGSMMIMEPALRETSRALLEVRDRLVQKQFAIRAPCMFKGMCPALAKPVDWCHADRQWRMPKVVEAIARGAQLHKESLKLSYLVVAPKPEGWPAIPSGQVFRIVSESLEGKGRQRFMGCGPEGRLGLALQDKHRTADNEAFFTLQRGDVIRVTNTEPRGDGVSMTEQSVVKVVAKAGRGVPPGDF